VPALAVSSKDGNIFPFLFLLAVWASCRAEPVRLHVIFVAWANLPIGADVSGFDYGLLGLAGSYYWYWCPDFLLLLELRVNHKSESMAWLRLLLICC
jgi:hypothetical protein